MSDWKPGLGEMVRITATGARGTIRNISKETPHRYDVYLQSAHIPFGSPPGKGAIIGLNGPFTADELEPVEAGPA
jgi:hypothetical protein